MAGLSSPSLCLCSRRGAIYRAARPVPFLMMSFSLTSIAMSGLFSQFLYNPQKNDSFLTHNELFVALFNPSLDDAEASTHGEGFFRNAQAGRPLAPLIFAPVDPPDQGHPLALADSHAWRQYLAGSGVSPHSLLRHYRRSHSREGNRSPSGWLLTLLTGASG